MEETIISPTQNDPEQKCETCVGMGLTFCLHIPLTQLYTKEMLDKAKLYFKYFE